MYGPFMVFAVRYANVPVATRFAVDFLETKSVRTHCGCNSDCDLFGASHSQCLSLCLCGKLDNEAVSSSTRWGSRQRFVFQAMDSNGRLLCGCDIGDDHDSDR